MQKQPLPFWDVHGMAEIKKRSPIPIMADESVHSPEQARIVCEHDACDIVNIKFMKCGGIYNAIKINAICESAGIRCMIGCMAESNLANVAGMHLAAALDNIAEVDLDSLFILNQDVVSGGFSNRGGYVTLLDEPGIGCIIH